LGGDPTSTLLPSDATPEEKQWLRNEMGLDKPLTTQYVIYMKGLFSGNLGFSYFYNMNVLEIVKKRLPQTLKLGIVALLMGSLLAFPFGIVAGIKKGRPIDFGAMFFAILGQSMAQVWLAILLILIFAVKLRWLPTQGNASIRHIIMPAICIAFGYCATTTRMLRSQMVEVLEEDYITATRARGISNFKIYTKYALRNALLPIVTMMGGSIGILMAGSIIVETVFAWPGLGQVMTTAIQNRDYQLVQAVMIINAGVMVVSNLLTDILYTFIDPRISMN
jgi:ABC-type dipeptide/oligopeptide/nickel transport system permease component